MLNLFSLEKLLQSHVIFGDIFSYVHVKYLLEFRRLVPFLLQVFMSVVRSMNVVRFCFKILMVYM